MRIDKMGAGSILTRLLLAAYFLSIISCISIKPGGTKSGKNLYETFYVGEEGTQYFIKPLSFSGKNKVLLKLDFTFRYKVAMKDSAVVNISFLNTEIIRCLDSVKIANGTNTMVFKKINCLFAEQKEKMYHTRFTAKGSLAELHKLFDKSNWNLTAYEKNNSGIFTTPKATEKKIQKMKESIFTEF